MPCGYTDLSNVFESGEEQTFYSFEVDDSKAKCDSFDPAMKDGDLRYRDLGDRAQWSINEYDL